jgi:hypothetical protein
VSGAGFGIIGPGHPLHDIATAAVQGEAVMEDFAAYHGGKIQRNPSSGFMLELERRLKAGLTGGTIDICDHIKRSPHPQPMFWVPYDPDLVRCAQCHDAVQLGIADTDEDDRCDQCGQRSPGLIYAMLSQTPAGIEGGVAFGPMILTYGVCQVHRDEQLAADAEVRKSQQVKHDVKGDET